MGFLLFLLILMNVVTLTIPTDFWFILFLFFIFRSYGTTPSLKVSPLNESMGSFRMIPKYIVCVYNKISILVFFFFFLNGSY
jgi:hypothetical protein